MSDRDATIAPVRAIVAGHGDFAEGLVSAVELITGRGNVLHAVSGRGQSAESLETLLRAAIDTTGAKVVFTDMQAGSCTMAARRVLRDRREVLFVCGTNLPMLLDFALSAEASPVDAARHALERGKDAIVALGGS